MDVTHIPATLTATRPCGDIPCGQCAPCHHRVMTNVAAYALKEEDPKGVLLDLLDKLGLPPSGV